MTLPNNFMTWFKWLYHQQTFKPFATAVKTKVQIVSFHYEDREYGDLKYVSDFFEKKLLEVNAPVRSQK